MKWIALTEEQLFILDGLMVANKESLEDMLSWADGATKEELESYQWELGETNEILRKFRTA